MTNLNTVVEFFRLYLTAIIGNLTQREFVQENWKTIVSFSKQGYTNVNNGVKSAYNAWKSEPNNATFFEQFIKLLSGNKTGWFQCLNDIERIGRRYGDTDLSWELFTNVYESKTLTTTDIAELNKISAIKETLKTDIIEKMEKMVSTTRKRGGGKSSISMTENDVPDMDI